MLFKLLAIVSLLSFAFAALAGQPQGKNPVVEVEIEGRGKFDIEFFAIEAPKTVAHILRLVEEKFFDGMLIHRVVPNFVVQTGDPKSKKMKPEEARAKPGPSGGTEGIGDGGSGKNIPFEENTKQHDRGTLGMALTGARTDTGDSQWFINLRDNHRLNGDYCVFGKVLGEGMTVVDKIERGDRIVAVRLKK